MEDSNDGSAKVSPGWVIPGFSWRSRREALAFVLVLVALAAFYLFSYYISDDRPRVGALHPLGWWGWSDQGAYLLSMKAFATGGPQNFIYPPLYPLLAAPFWLMSHDHGVAIIDLIYFLAFYGVLIVVTRRFYGAFIPAAVSLAMLVFLPVITIEQWIIPWTTSLTAALASILILIFSCAETRQQPFALRTGRDWLVYTGFFLAYGALAPTRPLDIVIWFPFALAYFLRTIFATAGQAPPERRGAVFARCFSTAAAAGAVSVVGYLAFNLLAQGRLFGNYGEMARQVGYFPREVVQKIFSLFWNGYAVYADEKDAFFTRIPVLFPFISISLASLFFVRGVIFWVLLTIYFNIIVYSPYGDLLPTNTFTFYLIHYFKWLWPWVAVIAVGQFLVWLRRALEAPSLARWTPIIVSIGVILIGLDINLEPVDQTLATHSLSATTRTITLIAPHGRPVHFIDIPGLNAGFELNDPDRKLWVNGKPFPNNLHRLFPYKDGARLIFPEPVSVSRIDLIPGRLVHFPDETGEGIMSSVAVVSGCLFRDCAPPANKLAWRDGAIRIGLETDPPGISTDDWSGAEPWGRWSKTPDAALQFAIYRPQKKVVISSRVGALIGPGRRKARISLWINGCKIGEKKFYSGEKQIIEGPVPQRCLDPEGRVKVEWRTDRALRPVDLHMNGDNRTLAVAVDGLTLREKS